MAAVADAVVVVPPPPQPEPAFGRRSGITAAKVVMYLCLASLWVCCAGLAAAAVARHVRDVDSPMVYAFLKVSAGAALLAALLIAVFFLLLLRAMTTSGIRPDTEDEAEAWKVSRASMWEMLQNTGVLGVPACFPFLLLLVILYPVVMGLSPIDGSGAVYFDLWLVVGSMTLCCFNILPVLALKLWKMNG